MKTIYILTKGGKRMARKRLILSVLLGILFTLTACTNSTNIESEVRNPDSIISEPMKIDNLKVLELDSYHNDNKKVLDIFGEDLEDGVYAYEKDKFKTYILIKSDNMVYSDFSFKLESENKILTLSYSTSEGSTTNKKTLFLIESKKKNLYEEIKLLNNGNEDGFLGVYSN